MKRRPTLRLRTYGLAGLVGLIAALGLGQPGPALVGVALLALVAMGLVAGEAPAVSVQVDDPPTTIVEGEERAIRVSVISDVPIRRLHLDLALGGGLALVAASPAGVLDRSHVVLEVPGLVELEATIRAEGWGRRSLGPIQAYIDSPFGMIEMTRKFDQTVRMMSVPSDLTVSEMLSPRDTNLHVGDLVSKLRGVGSEFSELRQYRSGDDPRALNWRVSSRSGSWWVNDRHPERNGDVVLVVDAQTQPGTGSDILVDRAVRLAGALLREYGKRRYRLGLVTVDGVARWIQPGSGEAHRRRILDQLLGVQDGDSSRVAIERAVLRVAKRPALVFILTPMLDDSLVGIAHSLRISGLDMALIEVDPIGFLPEPSSEVRAVGRRVWRMERERLRDLLAGDGIPIAPWRSGDPPDVPLAQISSWRSSWRLPV